MPGPSIVFSFILATLYGAAFHLVSGGDARRLALAKKVFAHTAAYDAAITNYLTARDDAGDGAAPKLLPDVFTQQWRKVQDMRYGENPHQSAAFYRDADPAAGTLAHYRQLQGKELSYNNINDTDAAYELVGEFDPARTAAVAIIKHANPCGVAVSGDLMSAYRDALRTDPVSAFGGIVATNREIDAATATEIVKVFTEVIVAPSATREAQDIIAAKKNLRLLLTGGLANAKADGLLVKSVAGGLLVQSRDNRNVDDCELKVVTRRQPSAAEMADLLLAAKVAKHVKSNAIVYVKAGATVGIGAGQMSRVDSANLAVNRARFPLDGCAVASDAFFPFPDALEVCANAGATCVIHPGGSKRDDESLALAEERGMAMVVTGRRHFRH